MKKLIAITGGIGSGKSAVLNYVRSLGYPAYSCDEIYKEIVISSNYIQKIKEKFPECVIDGLIDKRILSTIIFSDKKKRKELNAIAHPMIMELLFQRMRNTEGKIIFAEVPLLFENNYEKLFDEVIVILREREQRKNAVKQRDGISDEEFKNRIEAQFDYDSEAAQKRLGACKAKIFYNNSDVKTLYAQIKKEIETF